jgi:hypothetical protein
VYSALNLDVDLRPDSSINTRLGLAAEIFDVNIGAEPNVVGEVPADMVRIGIEHDVVAIPEPVVAVVKVGRGDAEEGAVKAEALASATSETVDVRGAKGAWKMSVFPRPIEVVTCVVSAGIVTDPAIRSGIHVGSVGMSGLLGKLAELALRWRSAPAIGGNRSTFGRGTSTNRGSRSAFGRASRGRRGAASRDMPATDWSALRSSALFAAALSAAALLCKNRKGKEKCHREKSDQLLHAASNSDHLILQLFADRSATLF